MLAEPMSVEKAKEIAAAIATGQRKYGPQFAPAYRSYEILEACMLLGQFVLGLEALMVPKEDLTLANRRLAACEARVAKLSKKNEKNPDEG
jgi:hypothetical protein